VLSDDNSRLVAARRLTDRRVRRDKARFLAEGPQAVREAVRRGDVVVELFGTADALDRHAGTFAGFEGPIDEVSSKAVQALTETVNPQGLVAVCRAIDVDIAVALGSNPTLVAVLVESNDPGNAGTILRTADAAGADAVVLTGHSVDLYNGKLVRASAGSIFHLPIAVGLDYDEAVSALSAAGLHTVATSGSAESDIFTARALGQLAVPTAWLFGNEARGLSPEALNRADRQLRVPIYGSAESLNVASAAAVCLYASAGAQRGGSGGFRRSDLS
jgi:TrmH family RNA methyltransferase